MTARARPARADSALQHVLCATPSCAEPVAVLQVPRGPFGTVLFNPLGPARAAIRMTTEYRLGADSVWRITDYARDARAIRARGEPARFTARVPREAIGEAPKMTTLRRQPPIPAIVECPRCATHSVITNEFLEAAYRSAAQRIAGTTARQSTVPGQLGNAPFSITPSETLPPGPTRQRAGQRRGGIDRPRGGSPPGPTPLP